MRIFYTPIPNFYSDTAELGDREEEDRRVLSYLENIRLGKQYSPAFISKVVDLHSNLEGMSEGEADYRLLDAARKLEFYGLKLHPARNKSNLKRTKTSFAMS
ncbi:hypothetical protein TcWFU_005039 [Taenia crassiceps]|uniref:FERM domain-containing protein n=1 Tax=Taenia crassiceps TaxID=6207 RepID=A0ABR4QRN0_9CEST